MLTSYYIHRLQVVWTLAASHSLSMMLEANLTPGFPMVRNAHSEATALVSSNSE